LEREGEEATPLLFFVLSGERVTDDSISDFCGFKIYKIPSHTHYSDKLYFK
jgi:hypothetical protein